MRHLGLQYPKIQNSNAEGQDSGRHLIVRSRITLLVEHDSGQEKKTKYINFDK